MYWKSTFLASRRAFARRNSFSSSVKLSYLKFTSFDSRNLDAGMSGHYIIQLVTSGTINVSSSTKKYVSSPKIKLHLAVSSSRHNVQTTNGSTDHFFRDTALRTRISSRFSGDKLARRARTRSFRASRSSSVSGRLKDGQISYFKRLKTQVTGNKVVAINV